MRYQSDLPGGASEYRTRAKLDNLIVPNLAKKDLEDLLFSVSLQKNEEMTTFVADYNKYLDVLAGTVKFTEKLLEADGRPIV